MIDPKYCRDTSLFEITPERVVTPENSSDLMELVKFVNEHKKDSPDLSLTVRAAGTDMTGGPLTDSILIDAMVHMNKILSWTSDTVTVQPGVFYKDLEKELDFRNLLLPSYPASKEACALGGMVANNSGGEKTLQYGKTDKYLKSLKIVLSDGKEYLIEPLDKKQLDKKLKLKNFEGQIYKNIYNILSTNYNLLESSRPIVSKNSSGYNIWDVISKDGSIFDLTKLIVGSQGTLGIITEATLKLVPKETKSSLYVVFFKDLSRLPEFTKLVLELRPSSVEITDDHTFKLYLRYFREMAQILGSNGLIQSALLFLPEFLMILKSGLPKLVCLVEFAGNNQEKLDEKISFLQKTVDSLNLVGHKCKDQKEADKYWRLRRDTFKLLRQKIKGLYPASFVDDLIVQPELLSEFLPKLQKILDASEIIYTISGHLGDGNLHIIPLVDLKKPGMIDKIFSVTDEVYDLVLQYHGSLSAEHNDGLIRGPYLEKEYGPEVFEIFKEIKKIFDPQNIFNPHKKTDSSMEWTRGHVRKS